MTSAGGGRVVLVVGPGGAGAGRLVDAVRGRMPEAVFVEPDGLDLRQTPCAVVAVVSAVAPVSRSDWEQVERAAARTELVIGVVSKIDAHRGWRDVLAVNRSLVAGWAARYAGMRWLGAAAAPDLGESNLDELVAVLRDGLADPSLERRNQLRCRAFVGVNRQPHSVGAIELRGALQTARLRLTRFVRDRTSSMRTELRDAAAGASRGDVVRFESRVRVAVDRFGAELDAEISAAVSAAASTLGLRRPRPVAPHEPPEIVGAPLRTRRLERRLMAVLGAGFGLGIALASGRVLAGLASVPPVVGMVAGGLVGLTFVVWVARVRGLLNDRALLDRWITEVAATARWHGEMVVAERLLGVEMGFLTEVRRPRRAAPIDVRSDRGQD